ncbi:protein AIM2 [Favolaschia claudopus]|uniref:Protein AIM2 n=1 Tax=Favolaschia claudopus TaxID=2862362 RepID=A0AAW0C321_9AGAR
MACTECLTGVIQKGTPIGKEEQVAGLSTYTVGAADSTQIVIIGTDIFGWKFVNTRLLADEYASHGFRVLVPDLFDGYQIPQWTLSARDPVNERPTLVQRIARPFSLSIMIPFVLRNGHSTQTAKLKKLAEQLRQEHAGAKIGFVGFCWGGRYAITLNSLFDASVAAHPSLVKYPAELDGVTKPISFALAPTDHNYDARRGEETENLLKEKGLTDVEVVVYPGVQHGFTIRADLQNEQKKEARDKAVAQVVEWFQRYLI